MGEANTGRVAIVTGASRGIGAAIAIALAAEGSDVVVHYQHNREAAESVKATVEAAGRRAVIAPGAIESPGTAEALVAAGLDAFGRIDIVINNAGIINGGFALHESEVAEVEQQFRVHCLGAFALTKAALPHMLKQSRGDMVYISSTAVKKLIPSTGPYAMAKAAAETMAFIMAKELCRQGIHVNIVGPGLTVTDMNMGKAIADEAALAELDKTMPFGRVCRPEEVAAMVAFLCSPENSYASGERIYIDGARGP